jgi:hypothetical protein
LSHSRPHFRTRLRSSLFQEWELAEQGWSEQEHDLAGFVELDALVGRRGFDAKLAGGVEKAPTGPNWVHEMKFDGYRWPPAATARRFAGQPVSMGSRALT